MRRAEPPGMRMDPAQVSGDLKEPAMEAGQPNLASRPSGWECPRCGIVWAPRVDRCTCEPESMDERVEITEGGTA